MIGSITEITQNIYLDRYQFQVPTNFVRQHFHYRRDNYNWRIFDVCTLFLWPNTEKLRICPGTNPRKIKPPKSSSTRYQILIFRYDLKRFLQLHLAEFRLNNVITCMLTLKSQLMFLPLWYIFKMPVARWFPSNAIGRHDLVILYEIFRPSFRINTFLSAYARCVYKNDTKGTTQCVNLNFYIIA